MRFWGVHIVRRIFRNVSRCVDYEGVFENRGDARGGRYRVSKNAVDWIVQFCSDIKGVRWCYDWMHRCIGLMADNYITERSENEEKATGLGVLLSAVFHYDYGVVDGNSS